MLQQEEFNLYKDIQTRTNGELFLGVVGPVRTGKSTFIRRFMNQVVIPNMESSQQKLATDELPVSGKGTLITTVEPKFVPKEAVEMAVGENINIKIRLIDCVGFIVDGATGVFDQEKERLVKTPWFNDEIPFSQAAHIGTQKVINDHATIGIVVTSDASFGEINREQFEDAEEQTVQELKKIGKPFIVILNSSKPYSENTQELSEQLSLKYGVACVALNCDQIRQADIHKIMEAILYEFPVTAVNFYMPKWIDILPYEHELRKSIIETIKTYMEKITTIKDIEKNKHIINNPNIEKYYIDEINTANGTVNISLSFNKAYYYDILSRLLSKKVRGEFEFLQELSKIVNEREKYCLFSSAIDEVKQKGYGSVMPLKEEINIADPIIIKHGNKYGVNIKAIAPSIHMISAEIETEIAPLVGTQQQAQDLVDYIKSAKSSEGNQSIWDTLIFGKTMGELVDEGLKTKIGKLTENCQEKLQETLQKIINESNGNIIFIII